MGAGSCYCFVVAVFQMRVLMYGFVHSLPSKCYSKKLVAVVFFFAQIFKIFFLILGSDG